MKVWLIIAAALVLAGIILFSVVMTANGWDFKKLSTESYETNTHSVTDPFENISIRVDTADVAFQTSPDGTCKIVCYEDSREKHRANVENGTLTITAQTNKKWYDHIGFQFGTPKITVYLPGNQYGSLELYGSTGDVSVADFTFSQCRIDQSTGKIRLQDLTAESLELTVSTGGIDLNDITCTGELKATVSTGKMCLRNVTCKNLISDGNTGDLTLKNVTAAEGFSLVRTTGDLEMSQCIANRFFIKTSTGDVEFEGCDAGEITIETSTGDVEGSFLTPKIFDTETSTGEVEVPLSGDGGLCRITTSTGDIEITVR